MNIPQLTALCLRYQGVLLDASEEVVHVAVVDAPSHELLDALHFATTKRIEITCWTRQQMEGHVWGGDRFCIEGKRGVIG